jgi:hypothetical protein
VQAAEFEPSSVVVRLIGGGVGSLVRTHTQNQLQNDDRTDGTHERWIVVTGIAWPKMKLEPESTVLIARRRCSNRSIHLGGFRSFVE